MTRGAIYVRISRDSMVGGVAEAGIERQESDCRAHAAKLGIDIVEVFRDNDVSAFSGKRRPGYESLIAAIQAGRFDAVVVWHTDRLYRRVSTLISYIAVCNPHNVQTYAVMVGGVDLTTPTGEATAVTIAAWSQYESAMKGLRQQAANVKRAQLGGHMSSVRVFGYEPDGKTLRASEADAIRQAYQSIIDGVPLAGVCRQWNAAGLRTSGKDRAWNGTLLSQLLRNPRHAGLKTYKPRGVVDKKTRGYQFLYQKDGTPVRGQWESVVDEDTWRAAQAVLSDPARRWPHPPQQLLSGVAICGVCGMVMHSGGTRKSANGEHRRIRCSGAAGHAYREAAPIEVFVTQVVLEYLRRPNIMQELAVGDDSAGLTASIRQKLADVQVRSDLLVQGLTDGDVTPQQLRTGQARLRAQRAELESRLPMPQNQTVRRLIAAESPEALWEQLSDEERRVVIDELLTIEILPSRTKEATYLDWRQRIVNPASVRLTWKRTSSSLPT